MRWRLRLPSTGSALDGWGLAPGSAADASTAMGTVAPSRGHQPVAARSHWPLSSCNRRRWAPDAIGAVGEERNRMFVVVVANGGVGGDDGAERHFDGGPRGWQPADETRGRRGARSDHCATCYSLSATSSRLTPEADARSRTSRPRPVELLRLNEFPRRSPFVPPRRIVAVGCCRRSCVRRRRLQGRLTSRRQAGTLSFEAAATR